MEVRGHYSITLVQVGGSWVGGHRDGKKWIDIGNVVEVEPTC